MRLTLFLLLLAGSVSAQVETTSPDVVSFETGVICAPPTVGESPAPDTVAGATHIIDVDPPFVSTDNRVPAVLGIGFGAKTQVAQPGGIADVTIVITHPPMGAQKATSQSYQSRISGIDPSLMFYQFDYTYELLPGVWTIRAIKDGQTIYKSRFEVLPPQLIPELASVCGFEDLLS